MVGDTNLEPCPHCEQMMNKKSISRHVENVHNKTKNFQCQHCDKKFGQKSTLEKHVKAIHDKEKPHLCPKCHMSFAFKYALEEHIKTHDENRTKFKCNFCYKSFVTKFVLKYHIQNIHNKIKAYKCPHCEYKCAKNANLRSHMSRKHPNRVDAELAKSINVDSNSHENSENVSPNKGQDDQNVHNRIKAYNCPHCEYKSAKNANLKSHMTRKHPNSSDRIDAELTKSINVNSNSYENSENVSPNKGQNDQIQQIKCKKSIKMIHVNIPDVLFPLNLDNYDLIDAQNQADKVPVESTSISKALANSFVGNEHVDSNSHENSENVSPNKCQNDQIGSLVKLVTDEKYPFEVKVGIIISIETILTENMIPSYSEILSQKDFIVQLGQILNKNPTNKEHIYRLAQKIATISSDAKTLVSKSIGICEEYLNLDDIVETFKDRFKNEIKIEIKKEFSET